MVRSSLSLRLSLSLIVLSASSCENTNLIQEVVAKGDGTPEEKEISQTLMCFGSCGHVCTCVHVYICFCTHRGFGPIVCSFMKNPQPCASLSVHLCALRVLHFTSPVSSCVVLLTPCYISRCHLLLIQHVSPRSLSLSHREVCMSLSELTDATVV